MSQIRMCRKGTVKATTSSPYQCKSLGHDNYGWEVQITTKPYPLDEFGFIIDNMLIQQEVNEVFCMKDLPSCEILVIELAASIKRLCQKHCVMYEDIHIRLWPMPGCTGLDPDNIASFEYSLSGNF